MTCPGIRGATAVSTNYVEDILRATPSMLDQIVAANGVEAKDIKNMIIWGNHSSTQYPDIHHAKVKGQSALSLVDNKWFVDDFIPTVQQRGAAIIKARGQSSAASAANAAINQMKAWATGTKEGDWVSMAVPSDCSYGIQEGLVYSYPVTVVNNQINIVKGLELSEFCLGRMKLSEN